MSDMIKHFLNPSNCYSVYMLECQHLTLFPTAFQEYLNLKVNIGWLYTV